MGGLVDVAISEATTKITGNRQAVVPTVSQVKDTGKGPRARLIAALGENRARELARQDKHLGMLYMSIDDREANEVLTLLKPRKLDILKLLTSPEVNLLKALLA